MGVNPYEHECEHNTRFVSYPETGPSFCTLCEIERLNEELSACTSSPGGCGYWRKSARLRRAERDEAREAARKCYNGMLREADTRIVWRDIFKDQWPWLKEEAVQRTRF
jgi:hypothetical protein